MLGLVVVTLGVMVVRARWLLEKSYASVAQPRIVADASVVGVQRGEMLFQSLCMECHGGSDGRASGKRLDEVPAFLGTFYAANLAHPTLGVKQRSDGEIARVLRFGVLPSGRLSVVMSSFGGLGDADVAAIIGYMRSGAPEFEAASIEQPRSSVSLLGATILTYVAGIELNRPAVGVPVPPKAVSVEYGRYMARAMDCVGCHTEGFSSDKLQHPRAFAGGFELTDPSGEKIFTKNITFDESTGIGRWSVDDFARAVTRGVTPQGYMVRKPMPLFSRLDTVDVAAIYRFLQTVPKVSRHNQPGGQPIRPARSEDRPAQLFVNVGCASCHGEKAPHRDKIAPALGKSDADVASWILDPQVTKPGSIMPSFARSLSRAQAEGLARYVKQLASERGAYLSGN
ncbi:MAG: c-type cytochrome [Polyangiaceae bacterium]